MHPLLEVYAENYRSLRDVHVELQPLSVLVGPNESGKSNFLDVLQFLGDSVRLDLGPAIEARDGFDRLQYRGQRATNPVRVGVKANVTKNSSTTAPDEYNLSFWSPQPRRKGARRYLARQESFKFKRTRGSGRRITVKGDNVEVVDVAANATEQSRGFGLRSDSLGLATLPRLADSEGGTEIARIANLFSTFRVFDVDVNRARRPGRLGSEDEPLDSDGSNLASFLWHLRSESPEAFDDLEADARAMIPGLLNIDIIEYGSSTALGVAIVLTERGLAGATDFWEASYGTVRIISMLALLYDQHPPLLTCIEEIDHGLHPYVFDRLVERMREATSRTQIIAATHSPSLVNRLEADELVVCERGVEGASRIPAISSSAVRRRMASVTELELGELWFSGALGGVVE